MLTIINSSISFLSSYSSIKILFFWIIFWGPQSVQYFTDLKAVLPCFWLSPNFQRGTLLLTMKMPSKAQRVYRTCPKSCTNRYQCQTAPERGPSDIKCYILHMMPLVNLCVLSDSGKRCKPGSTKIIKWINKVVKQ